MTTRLDVARTQSLSIEETCDLLIRICQNMKDDMDTAIQRAEQWQAYAGKLREVLDFGSGTYNPHQLAELRIRTREALALPNPDETSFNNDQKEK